MAIKSKLQLSLSEPRIREEKLAPQEGQADAPLDKQSTRTWKRPTALLPQYQKEKREAPVWASLGSRRLVGVQEEHAHLRELSP